MMLTRQTSTNPQNQNPRQSVTNMAKSRTARTWKSSTAHHPSPPRALNQRKYRGPLEVVLVARVTRKEMTRTRAKTVVKRQSLMPKTTSSQKLRTLRHLSPNLSSWHAVLPMLPLRSEAHPIILIFMDYVLMTTRSTYAYSLL